MFKKNSLIKKVMGGVIIDETGISLISGDRTKKYATPVSAKINDEELYTFDSEKGLLRLSMSPEDVENLVQVFGKFPKDGRYLEIPDPFGLESPARFEGIKSIESLPKPADGNYFMSSSEARPQQRKTLRDRLKNYLN